MIDDYKDIWVFIELKKDKIRGVSLELLGKAKELALKSNEKVCAVLLGNNLSKFCEELSNHGIDKIYICENELLKEYLLETYSLILVELIKNYMPSILLIPATKLGRELAPRIAATVETGLTADCIDLDIQEGNLIQTRTVYGANYLADIICPNERPQIATVRPNVIEKSKVSEKNNPEIIQYLVEIEPSQLKTKIIEKIEITTISAKPIDEADVIVSGGRGIGSKENFKI
ncbi:MAG: electron transfer flavoprotein subunit alpha/FixB family protein, partial [Candidatus Thorarchaeota archaeon]